MFFSKENANKELIQAKFHHDSNTYVLGEEEIASLTTAYDVAGQNEYGWRSLLKQIAQANSSSIVAESFTFAATYFGYFNYLISNEISAEKAQEQKGNFNTILGFGFGGLCYGCFSVAIVNENIEEAHRIKVEGEVGAWKPETLSTFYI